MYIHAPTLPGEHALALGHWSIRVEAGWIHSRVLSLIVWRCTYLTKGLFSSPVYYILSSPLKHTTITHPKLPLVSESRRPAIMYPPQVSVSIPSFLYSSVFTSSSASFSVQTYLPCLSRTRLQCQSSGSRIPCSVFRVMCLERALCAWLSSYYLLALTLSFDHFPSLELQNEMVSCFLPLSFFLRECEFVMGEIPLDCLVCPFPSDVGARGPAIAHR